MPRNTEGSIATHHVVYKSKNGLLFIDLDRMGAWGDDVLSGIRMKCLKASAAGAFIEGMVLCL